jgi:aspartate dehydrogenase
VSARRIGIIGHGAVGSVVADALERGEVPGAVLAGVHALSEVPEHRRIDSVAELVAHSDLVVEAASQDALRSYGAGVLAAGRDLLVVSVGALVDDVLRARLVEEAGGSGARLLVTTGAIGGVDLLRAAASSGPIESVTLETVKPTEALARPWMTPDLLDALRRADGPVEVFDGPAREAVAAFPESVNVAATLSLVTIGFDRVRVRIVGDPGAAHVTHTISAAGAAGEWHLVLRNRPSPMNPRTSALTPHAVLRGLHDLGATVVVGW